MARTLERLTQAIEARGGAVRVVTVDDPEAVADSRIERWPSVPFWAYPQLRMAAPSRQRALDLIDGWKPTLVHIVTEFGVGLGGLFAALESRVPVVSSYHTNFQAYLEFYGLQALAPVAWPYFRWLHNSGLRTFVPTGFAARELEAHGVRNVRVWSRGVDPSRFAPAFRSQEVRQRLGAADGRPLVLYVGRLAGEKGIDVLMDALQIVRAQRGDSVAFAIVGDGPAEAGCRARAPEGTVFAGKLTGRELSEAYASGDIFAFPSITETFGNVVLEAMASGLAVVAPDVGATTEYATPATARQFRAGNAQSLADAILGLVDHPVVRSGLQQAGLATARARTWDAVWDTLVRDYHEVLAE
ncbi:MAG: glycosyltransferase family 1 protein [Gemmatimonadota bacterium]|nr:glycosyltransferase family 1 protein [Gemmatimonadota bacterium]